MSGSLPAVPLESLTVDDPRQLGPYRLLGRLGAGGMGVAYLAEGPVGWAVVKTMWPQFRTDRAYVARLSRELTAMRAAAGPYVARVLDEQLEGENPWFAMEFVPGVTLKRLVEESGALPPSEVSKLAAGLAQAILVIAGAGVVHRDLKPANIMMSPAGPRLIDFGVAELSDATQLTQTGAVVGSAGWLAPEQITGGAITPATDVHAWGLSVLFAATGFPSFAGANTTATIYEVLHVEPVVPVNVFTQDLEGLVRAATAKDPGSRPTPHALVAGIRVGGEAGGSSPMRETAVEPPPAMQIAQPAQKSTTSRNRVALFAVCAAALVAVGLAVALISLRSSGTSTVSTAPLTLLATSSASTTTASSEAPTAGAVATVTAAPVPAVTTVTPAPVKSVVTVTAVAPPPTPVAVADVRGVAGSWVGTEIQDASAGTDVLDLQIDITSDETGAVITWTTPGMRARGDIAQYFADVVIQGDNVQLFARYWIHQSNPNWTLDNMSLIHSGSSMSGRYQGSNGANDFGSVSVYRR